MRQSESVFENILQSLIASLENQFHDIFALIPTFLSWRSETERKIGQANSAKPVERGK